MTHEVVVNTNATNDPMLAAAKATEKVRKKIPDAEVINVADHGYGRVSLRILTTRTPKPTGDIVAVESV